VAVKASWVSRSWALGGSNSVELEKRPDADKVNEKRIGRLVEGGRGPPEFSWTQRKSFELIGAHVTCVNSFEPLALT
jgi:hypothetical protein